MTEAILPYMSGIHFVSIKGQNLALPPQSLEGLYVWTGHSLCTLARQALYDSAVRVALCLLFYMIMDKIINLIWLVVPSLLVLCWIRTLTAINIPVSYKSCFVWRVSSAYVCLTVVRWTIASPRILSLTTFSLNIFGWNVRGEFLHPGIKRLHWWVCHVSLKLGGVEWKKPWT